jgi:hypothetical protein
LGGFGRVAANEIQHRVVGLVGLYEGVILGARPNFALSPKRQCETNYGLARSSVTPDEYAALAIR